MIYFQNFPYKYKANESTTQLVYMQSLTQHMLNVCTFHSALPVTKLIFILSGKSYRQNNENKIIVNDCTPSVQKMR